jgi:hypothetical protein
LKETELYNSRKKTEGLEKEIIGKRMEIQKIKDLVSRNRERERERVL